MRRKLPRLGKFVRRRLHATVYGNPLTRVIFVVGSQRSGTRLPLRVLECAPEVITYSEGSAPFFDGVFLQPLQLVEQLLLKSPFPLVVLKPICETHRLNELLDHFPGSRGLWIFRNYRDAVNSASVKWRSGKEAVRRLACGELDRAGWRAGGLTPDKLDLVRRLYRDDLSLHAANAIIWYLRNDLYFDLRVNQRPDVLLTRYEDIVTHPDRCVARIFGFAGLRPPSNYDRLVYASSISKHSFPTIPEQIRLLCQSVEKKLIDHYREQAEKERPAVRTL